eukprot:361581-Chlamydomonas_euryale.AAC.3
MHSGFLLGSRLIQDALFPPSSTHARAWVTGVGSHRDRDRAPAGGSGAKGSRREGGRQRGRPCGGAEARVGRGGGSCGGARRSDGAAAGSAQRQRRRPRRQARRRGRARPGSCRAAGNLAARGRGRCGEAAVAGGGHGGSNAARGGRRGGSA